MCFVPAKGTLDALGCCFDRRRYMPIQSLEAVFYVEEPPVFDYRCGMFHVTQQVGSHRFDRVMSPHVFMLTLRRAAECARKHDFGGAKVLAFAERKAG